MTGERTLNTFERCIALFTRVHAGEGRSIGILGLQAFTLMAAYYLIRPVREALILTDGSAELRNYAVGIQALVLILWMPAYGLLMRRQSSIHAFQTVIAIFAGNLVIFFLLGQAGIRFSFLFFVWASIFGVMVVTQFWAFATDLFHVRAGQRLFGVIAIGVTAGAWAGSRIAAGAFDVVGPYGLMLAAAALLCAAVLLAGHARRAVPAESRCNEAPANARDCGNGDLAARWLGGLAVIARSRYLVGIAALVVLLNMITSTGDYLLSSWLTEIARQESPDDAGSYIGRFMGDYCSTITLAGFLIQLLLVSRVIDRAGVARALMVTPVVFLAGSLVIGIVPVFAFLQSVLIVQKSLDYSLLNTTRSALLLPATRVEKYQAKTAIDTLFYRLGDLLSTLIVFVGLKLAGDARVELVWVIVALSAAMVGIAWFIGREYRRRFGGDRSQSRDRALEAPGGNIVSAQ
jgi:ATP:ADP antiporter, AAA family